MYIHVYICMNMYIYIYLYIKKHVYSRVPAARGPRPQARLRLTPVAAPLTMIFSLRCRSALCHDVTRCSMCTHSCALPFSLHASHASSMHRVV